MPDAMRADMPERHRRALVLLPPSFGRWIVAAVAVAHQARFLCARRRFIDAAAGRFGIPRSIRPGCRPSHAHARGRRGRDPTQPLQKRRPECFPEPRKSYARRRGPQGGCDSKCDESLVSFHRWAYGQIGDRCLLSWKRQSRLYAPSSLRYWTWGQYDTVVADLGTPHP
jgi:hypothetical protein